MRAGIALTAAIFITAPSIYAQDSGEMPEEVDPSEALYAPRTDWSDDEGKTLNLSAFVFNDVNRNGTWDAGDRTMPGVAVALGRDEVGLGIKRSNANGFVNFPSSVTVEDAMIDLPGDYVYQLVPPPGWQVTTGNAAQTVTAVLVPGSASGIGFVDMPRPMGLARELFIQGAFAGDEPAKLTLTDEEGTELGGMISPGDTFTFKVEPGQYQVSDGTVTRDVVVTHNPVDIGHLSSRDPANGTANTATFDDLIETGLLKVPNGYQGVDWFNLNAMRRDFTSGSIGYVNGATSGVFIAYTSSGHPAEITSDTPFGIKSMQITASWGRAEGETVVVEMWRGDEKLVSDEMVVTSLGPVEYAPDISGITRMRIHSVHYWQLVLDDVVITHP